MLVFDPIEYLVSRRYPTWNMPIVSSLSDTSPTGARREMREKAQAYERELRGKTSSEIEELVRAEQAAEAEERRRKQETEEKGRFFNSPDAKADFSHWGKLSYWTLDEAVALSFGRAPEMVNWKMVGCIQTSLLSPFNISAGESWRCGRKRLPSCTIL